MILKDVKFDELIELITDTVMPIAIAACPYVPTPEKENEIRRVVRHNVRSMVIHLSAEHNA